MASPLPEGLLKKFREAKSNTMTFLAKKAGVSLSTYCRWEQGKTFPNDLEKRRQILEWLFPWLKKLYPALDMTNEHTLGAWCIAPKCPSWYNVVRFAKYKLTAKQSAYIHCHLLFCPTCQKRYNNERRVSTMLKKSAQENA